jgi:sugar phosphate isomerase/epimerase
MQLSFSPTLCPDLPLKETLDLAVEAGFERIELFRAWTDSSPVHPDISVRVARERLDEAGVSLTGLNIRNLTGRKRDSDERNLEYNLRQLTWDIHLAHALRLKQASLKGGARTDEAMEDLVEGLNKLLETHSDIQLNLGNHHGNRVQGLEDFKAVMPNVGDRVRVLLDTGHLLTSGENVMAVAEGFADRIGVVHLRDQKGDTPVPFGEGDLPLEDLLGLLSQSGFDGPIVIELERATWGEPVEAARQAKACVEDIVAKAA